MVNILINYIAHQRALTRHVALEVEENTPLTDLPTLLIKKIKEENAAEDIAGEILLIPTSLASACKATTAGEYSRLVKYNFHYTAVWHHHLSPVEQNLLAHASLKNIISRAYPAQNILNDTALLITFLRDFLPEDVKEALIVRFGDMRLNMYGLTVRDSFTEGPKRETVQLHPYPWTAAGSSGVIVSRDGDTTHIVCVYNQHRDPRPLNDPNRKKRIPNCLRVPEGYMHPKPCEGAGEMDIASIPPALVDQAERDILINKKDACSAYRDATQAEEQQASFQPAPPDETLLDCVIREMQEEVGVLVKPEEATFVGRQPEKGSRIPTIANVYLIEKEKGTVLKADGDEIGEAMWVASQDFHIEKDPGNPSKPRVTINYKNDNVAHPVAVEVPLEHAVMIGQAITKLNEKDIKQGSFGLFSSRENVEAATKRTLNDPTLNPTQKTAQDILGATPEEHVSYAAINEIPGDTQHDQEENTRALATLGKEGAEYHKKMVRLAKALTDAPIKKPLHAAELTAIAQGKTLAEVRQRALTNARVMIAFPPPPPPENKISASRQISRSATNLA